MIPLGVLASARRAAGGGGSLTADFVGATTSGADGTSYTFTDVAIGAAASDRTVVVAFGARSAASPNVTGVTIAGVTATIDHQAVTSGSLVCFAHAEVPAGTTGTVVVSLSSSAVRAGLGVWRVTGDAVTLSDTDSAAGTSGSVTVTIPSGGVGLVSATGSLSGSVFTFTNSTEDYEVQTATEGGRVAGGRLTGDTSTFTAATGTPQCIAVAYAPA